MNRSLLARIWAKGLLPRPGRAKVNVSSGAEATIHVTDSMDVVISSGATVRYYGEPQITSNITSGGKLESLSAD